MTSARNLFLGRIEKIVSLGLYQKVQLNCGFPLVAYVTHHSMENLSLKEEKVVMASFKATAIHVVEEKEDRHKFQIPGTHNQIITKISMTEIQRLILIKIHFGYSILDNWNFFGIWNLGFGILDGLGDF